MAKISLQLERNYCNPSSKCGLLKAPTAISVQRPSSLPCLKFSTHTRNATSHKRLVGPSLASDLYIADSLENIVGSISRPPHIHRLGVSVQGMYDRVHCGAACPPERLPALVALLRPEGGLLVTPVAPSDLRAITLQPDGTTSHRVLSQVRYSDLEVSTNPCTNVRQVIGLGARQSGQPEVPLAKHAASGLHCKAVSMWTACYATRL